MEADNTQERNGQVKRNYLREIAGDNPINLDIAEEVGGFPNRQAAAAWLNREDADGSLTVVGTMKERGRKPLKVYCNNWKPKSDNLRHEIIGTRVRLMFPTYKCERGYKLSDCFPDFLLTDGEHTYEGEIDCGTMKHAAHKARCKRHKCANDILVIVAPKTGNAEDRMQKLMSWSEELGDRGFFTTLERLTKYGPHSRIWDYVGRGNARLACVEMPVKSAFESYVNNSAEMATESEVSEVSDDGN